MKERKKITADELTIGDKAKVLELDVSNKEIKRHLLDMGITRGVEILIKKKAPMGDPIDISLRDYELCVSKKELSSIVVEVIR